MKSHKRWMVDVGAEYLRRKGLTVTEYINTIICKNVPMDEFAILLLARMFHRHFGVVLRDYIWTTGIGITIEDCTIVFAYTGDLQFMDTYDIGNKPAVTANTLTFKVPEQEAPVNLSASQDMENSISNQISAEQDVSNDKENSASQENNTEKDVSQDKSAEKEQSEVSSDKENSTLKPRNRKRSHSSSTSASRKPHKRPKRNRNLRSSPSAVNRRKPAPRSSRNSKKELCVLTLDDILSKNCRRNSVPKNLKEKDPLQENMPEEVLSDHDQHSDHSSDYDSPSAEEIKMDKGHLTVTQHGIKKCVKKDKSVICPVCDSMQKSQRQLNIHMKAEHPTFKFHCGDCRKEYSHYNACYKHIVHTHYQARHPCDHCEKCFPYPGDLKNHMKTHTGEGLLPCTYPKCKKKFTSNKSMFQHLQSHSDQEWKCELCDPSKIYNTHSNYRQHVKGVHNPPSLKAYCGKPYKWPYQRVAHQKDCKKCEAAKAAQLCNTPHPRKLPIRKG